jgi:hypothetical protein
VGEGGKDLSIVCYVCDYKVSAAWFYFTNTRPDGYVLGKKKCRFRIRRTEYLSQPKS